MKSSKFISLVLLVGMASQAHGMSWWRAAKIPTIRNVAMATIAAAGLGGIARAEGDKSKIQNGLRLSERTMHLRPYKQDVLEWVKNGYSKDIPYVYERSGCHSSNDDEQVLGSPCLECTREKYSAFFAAIPVLPFDKCVNDGRNSSFCSQVEAEQQRYRTAAMLISAANNKLIRTYSLDEMKKRAHVTGSFDDALLERYVNGQPYRGEAAEEVLYNIGKRLYWYDKEGNIPSWLLSKKAKDVKAIASSESIAATPKQASVSYSSLPYFTKQTQNSMFGDQ